MIKKIAQLIILIVLITSLTYSARALFIQQKKQRAVNQEIENLKKQANELGQKNQTLSSSLEFLESSAYKERSARESLNMKAEGEIAVSFIPENSTPTSSDESQKKPIPNPLKWWYYFFKTD